MLKKLISLWTWSYFASFWNTLLPSFVPINWACCWIYFPIPMKNDSQQLKTGLHTVTLQGTPGLLFHFTEPWEGINTEISTYQTSGSREIHRGPILSHWPQWMGMFLTGAGSSYHILSPGRELKKKRKQKGAILIELLGYFEANPPPNFPPHPSTSQNKNAGWNLNTNHLFAIKPNLLSLLLKMWGET